MVVTNTDSKLLSTSMAQTLTGATRRRVLIILKVNFTNKYVFILILFSVYFQSAYLHFYVRLAHFPHVIFTSSVNFPEAVNDLPILSP